ncbi:MAG: hypothetical protein ACOYH4_06770 [Saccharofermentanales bacterium]|jgi:hypothetical protein
MTFNIIKLGSGLAKADNGFEGRGDWDLYKCFFSEDEDYAEFYINLNVKQGLGKIAEKDSRYREVIEKHLFTE